MNILILLGGKSAERDVSVVSAEFVRKTLEDSGHTVSSIMIDECGEWSLNDHGVTVDTGHSVWKLRSGGTEIVFDVLFPVLHGPFGEDGTVQGLCELAGWAYAGADVMTSAIAMNKITTKKLASSESIPVLPWISVGEDAIPEQLDISTLNFPLFVKPARMGSSVGISKVDSRCHLADAVELARRYDSLVIIENGLIQPREIEVALLSESGTISSSVPGEIIPGLEWYDYQAKYNCSASSYLIPAPLSHEVAENIKRMAGRIFGALNGSGFARADFLLSGEDVFFNEINTIPGFTEISMFAKLWEASGVSNAELILRILEEARNRHAKRRLEVVRSEIT